MTVLSVLMSVFSDVECKIVSQRTQLEQDSSSSPKHRSHGLLAVRCAGTTDYMSDRCVCTDSSMYVWSGFRETRAFRSAGQI